MQAGWNDVNPSGQVKVQGASTYNVGTFTFNATKSSIKTILDNGAKIIGTINLVAGNSSMQFLTVKFLQLLMTVLVVLAILQMLILLALLLILAMVAINLLAILHLLLLLLI